MVFSEIYSTYFNTVSLAIRSAQSGELDCDTLFEIVRKSAFPESYLTISSALEGGKWALLKSDYSTNIKNEPTMPLSLLQKQWLKAILHDLRFRLFVRDDVLSRLESDLCDVEPLFTNADFFFYDQYKDGDPYDDEKYVETFRFVLKSLRDKSPLYVEYNARFSRVMRLVCVPLKIEYSEKDDKFRLIAKIKGRLYTLNIARIKKVRSSSFDVGSVADFEENARSFVTLELYDERKTLERAMMAFAHFEKSAVKIDSSTYQLTINYDVADETEMVIRVLSFGPTVKVLSPTSFRALVKERIQKQIEIERLRIEQ